MDVPRGAVGWAALIVTGVFAGTLGYLVATWVQAREAPFAALFGVLLAGDVLGWLEWAGCAVMISAIILAEPAAASALLRLAGRAAAEAV